MGQDSQGIGGLSINVVDLLIGFKPVIFMVDFSSAQLVSCLELVSLSKHLIA